MTKLTVVAPSVGELNSVAAPKVDTALQAIETWANGQVGTNNITAGSITEAMLEAALATKIGAKIAGLTFTLQNASYTAVSGDLVFEEKEGATVTLPTVVKDRIVEVFAGANGVKVKTNGGSIYGDFVEAVSEVVLQKSQHVRLQCNGTNWDILSGEVKREQEYAAGPTSRTAGVEYEPSATRLVYVTLCVSSTSEKTMAFRVKVNAREAFTRAQVAAIPAEKSTVPVGFPCPPGQKWVVENIANVEKVESNYLSL